MKKITILPLLCTLFLSFVHIAHAQQKLVMVNTSTVAYTTFTKDDGWIVFKNNEPQEIGENSFKFSCDVSFGNYSANSSSLHTTCPVHFFPCVRM